MGEQVVTLDVEQFGFNVVVEIFEQKVISFLKKDEVEGVGCFDDIPFGD